MFDSIMRKLQDQSFLEEEPEDILPQEEKKYSLSSASPQGMSDADAKCYSERYQDASTTDARTNWKGIGQQQGRQKNCAKNLTEYEADNYIKRNPEL